MYSAPAVECVSSPDEVVNQRRTAAQPIGLRRYSAKNAGGTRTHMHRLTKHVLRNGSRDMFQRPNEVVAEIPLLSVAFASDSGHARWPLREMPRAVTVPGSLQVRYLRVVIVTM